MSLYQPQLYSSESVLCVCMLGHFQVETVLQVVYTWYNNCNNINVCIWKAVAVYYSMRCGQKYDTLDTLVDTLCVVATWTSLHADCGQLTGGNKGSRGGHRIFDGVTQG